MTSIRAAVLASPGAAIDLRDVPLPPIESGGALLRVELSEVCGTDVHLQAGRLAGVPYPIIPGHVAVGRLEAIRGALRDRDGRPFAEGDRVTFLDVHGTCNACWFCLVAQATTRCPNRRVYGITYGLEHGPCGGWAEAMVLKPGTLCLRLDGVDPALFMAGGCSLPTALHALERGRLAPGETVLVLGSGPVGLSIVAAAAQQGAERVLCIGAPGDRLRAARAMGAAATLDFEERDEQARRRFVLGHTDGRGADLAIEATGDPRAVVEAMRLTRDAGRVVVAGQYTDGGEAAFNPHADLNRKHLDLLGCWGSDYSHFDRAVRLLRDPERSRPWAALPAARYPLGDAGEALRAVARRSVIKALIEP